MTIAAVIPCHNAVAYLGEAIESVRAQTRSVNEVIVVDDRSTDGSDALARAAGATLLRAGGAGPGAARNRGWRASECDLIAFLDADDRWLPDHCAVLSDLLERHPHAVLAFGGVDLIGTARGRFNAVLPVGAPVDGRMASALGCVVPQMGVMIRRRALEEVGGYDEALMVAEDFDLFARLSHLGAFVPAAQVTAQYRQYPEQTTRRRSFAVMLASVGVRHRNWLALESRLPPAERLGLEQQLRRLWEEALEHCWREGHREWFDAMLGAAGFVPGSGASAARWRRRARYGWHGWQIAAAAWRALRLRRLVTAMGYRAEPQT